MSPAKYTDLPPEVILQEDQRVAARSLKERAEICWHGKQDTVAVMVDEVSLAAEVILERGEDLLGVDAFGLRVNSVWSHQSSSVHCDMPHDANQALLPSGTKKWTFGCVLEISTTVG